MALLSGGIFINGPKFKTDDFVKVNLRGTKFVFPKSLVQKHPNTRLAQIQYPKDTTTKQEELPKVTEIYFDRNPCIFHQILDYYKTGKLHIPNNVCAESVREELSFWGIPWEAVHACCWKSFYQIDDDMDVLCKLMKKLPEDDDGQRVKSEEEKCFNSKLWECLQRTSSSKVGKIWRLLVILCVIISTFVYIVHGHKTFRVPRDHIPNYDRNTTEAKLWVYLDTALHPAVIVLEVICNALLMIDWLLLLCASPSKKAFFKSFLNVTDIVACIAIWITLTLDLNVQIYDFNAVRLLIPFLRALYTLRIFRVFRLVLNNSGMQILLLALRSSSTELFLLVLAFGSFSIMFAGLIYTFEFETGTSFDDMFISMWWAIITMTTVGYGDFYPSTAQGYSIGCLCALSGILLIAMPVAVTSSNFNDFFVFNKYRWRHSQNRSSEHGNYPSNEFNDYRMKETVDRISSITYFTKNTRSNTKKFGESNKVSPLDHKSPKTKLEVKKY